MLEIACFNASSALEAAKAGADRIELCADYAAGGVTPARDVIRSLVRGLKEMDIQIPVNVMIRPRGGDFVYTTAEFEQMKGEIELLKPEASGFVFGVLHLVGGHDGDGERYQVDEARNRELVELAAPLPCTFHRAIDVVGDMWIAVEMVVRCGFKAILTSGGEKDAVAGVEVVDAINKRFGGSVTFIMGGGVRATNVEVLKRSARGVWWFHSAAITAPGEEVDGEEVVRLQRLLGARSL